MASIPTKVVRFGPFVVTRQLFHTTRHSFALVNLRPLLPGHVLLCPHRVVPHLSDLTDAEIIDLSLTLRTLQRTLKRVYAADAFNVAVQDGKAAGQSVPHVHWHVIPRREADMDSRGGGDKLYEMLEGEEGNVGEHQHHQQQQQQQTKQWMKDEERKDRSKEEMEAEADMLKRELQKDLANNQSRDELS